MAGRCLICKHGSHVTDIPKADWPGVKNKQLTATPCQVLASNQKQPLNMTTKATIYQQLKNTITHNKYLTIFYRLSQPPARKLNEFSMQIGKEPRQLSKQANYLLDSTKINKRIEGALQAWSSYGDVQTGFVILYIFFV